MNRSTTAITIAKGRKRPIKEERWLEILQSAGEVFYEKGYNLAKLEDVGARVGLLKGSLYHYIDNKEDLLYAVALQVHEASLRDHLLSDRALGSVDARTRLCGFVDRWMKRIPTDPYRKTCVAAEREFQFLSSPRLEAVQDLRETFHHLLDDILEQGIAEGSFDMNMNVAVVSTNIFQILWGTLTWYRGSGPLSLDDLGGWYKKFLLTGLAPQANPR
jgi:AcrR family transcriptional regulator